MLTLSKSKVEDQKKKNCFHNWKYKPSLQWQWSDFALFVQDLHSKVPRASTANKGSTPLCIYKLYTNKKPSISQGKWGPKRPYVTAWNVSISCEFPGTWLLPFYCSCSFNWEFTWWNMTMRKRADENSVNTAFHLKRSSNTYNCFISLNFQHS